MAQLIFEARTSAPWIFLKVLESGLACLLRDFGLEEEEGRDLTVALFKNLRELDGTQGEGDCPTSCVLVRNGDRGKLELSCECSCDLFGSDALAAGIAEGREYVTAVAKGEDGRSLRIELEFSGS